MVEDVKRETQADRFWFLSQGCIYTPVMVVATDGKTILTDTNDTKKNYCSQQSSSKRQTPNGKSSYLAARRESGMRFLCPARSECKNKGYGLCHSLRRSAFTPRRMKKKHKHHRHPCYKKMGLPFTTGRTTSSQSAILIQK